MSKRHVSSLAIAALLLLCSAAWGDFAAGQHAYDSGDYAAALAEWQPLADGGDANAQFGLGLMYANGFGVPLDDDQALKWYGLAADQDHGEAQCNLAVMYSNGWGVPQSDADAIKWYELAAGNGVTAAQISLADLYLMGFAVPASKTQAYKWLTIAVEHGDLDAGYKRDELVLGMTAEEMAEAEGLAAAWLAERVAGERPPSDESP